MLGTFVKQACFYMSNTPFGILLTINIEVDSFNNVTNL